MTIKDLKEFKAVLKEDMETLFGECRDFKGVLRCMPENLGVTATAVIVEASVEAGLNPDEVYPLLHFHVTLAEKVPENFLPGILRGLNDLNTAISAGAFPSFGCFGYYPPLRQIYLSYRMPVNPDSLEFELVNVRYYLASLYEVLDLFADYVLFLCNDPSHVTLKDYMKYIDMVSDLNDIEFRLDQLETILDKYEKQTENDPDEETAAIDVKEKPEKKAKKKSLKDKAKDQDK